MPEETQEKQQPVRAVRCSHCGEKLNVKTMVRTLPTEAGNMLAVMTFCSACYKPVPMTLLPMAPTTRISSPAGLILPTQ